MKSTLMITGATGGLGQAFVMECASRGYNLLLTDLAPVNETYVSQLSQKFNIEVTYIPCDLSREECRTELLTTLKAGQFKFWGLINVAGLDNEGGFLERNRAQILKILNVNIIGTVDLTRGILPLRDPDSRFMLLNVCSMAGFYPMPYKATYAASKRYLLDFSCALREEIKAFGTVTALCPAGMPTTEECMRAIFAQGFWGLATTLDTRTVAHRAFNAALKGKRIVIPGLVNHFVHFVSSLVPASLSTRYVAKRWKKVRASRQESQVLYQASVNVKVPQD